MIERYEIVKKDDSIQVDAINWRGHRATVAEVNQDATLADIAQEFYELLASVNQVVIVVEES